jgi:predicted transcriptional regulator of viral defense system
VRQIELIDTLVAQGRESFTLDEARALLGSTSSAAVNVLRRLEQKGLVDRVARGHYAIRPLGALGTSAVTDNLGIAVAGAFEQREHRIAYSTALSEHGLLSHPVRSIYVACVRQVRIPALSKRRLRVVVERPSTIHLEAERAGPSWQSTLERALFESALRVDLAGGVERLAEALANAAPDVDATRFHLLAQAFGGRGLAAWRRLASISAALSLPLNQVPPTHSGQPRIALDPGDDHVEWMDDVYRVTWHLPVEDIRAVVEQ